MVFPDNQSKWKTCDLINNLSNAETHGKWLVFGDFNMVLSQDEKLGGNLVPNNHITLFRDTLQRNGLIELGFEGDKYTWNNNQNGESNIQARLDRHIATSEWIAVYPRAKVLNLLCHASDHKPNFLRLHSRRRVRRTILKLDRFEQMWLQDENIEEVVRE